MKITEKSKSMCKIILPPNPTPREVFAAEELCAYIQKITGVDISKNINATNHIIIGDPSRNPEANKIISQSEFDSLVPGPEGFIIKASKNALLLAGSSNNENEQERGTVYAVYEFLERFLGCSLSAYSKSGVNAGEYVPKTSDITIKNGTEYVKSSADIPYRTAIVQYSTWVGDANHALNPQFIGWLAKNRYNRILTWWGVYEQYKENGMLSECEKRGILFSVGHHQSFNMLLPPYGNKYFKKEYAKTNPEFYRLLEDGSRYEVKDGDYSGQLVLCMRNEELIDEMAKNIISWSEQNPQVDIISLWPHDGKHEQCICEHCKNHSKSDNYSYFANQVAKKVSKFKPNLKIDRIAYLDLLDSEDEMLTDSVVINEAVWHETLRTAGKPDGSSFENSDFEKNALSWKKLGARVVYYDYLMGIYSSKQRWLPIADEIQAIAKRFCTLGIYGSGTQIEPFNLWNHIFNFFSFARTLYDTSLTIEDNLEKFCRIFGEGAPFVKEIILLGEKTADGQDTIARISRYVIENIDRKMVYELYEKALETATSSLCKNNIRLMRMVWHYSVLEVTNPRFTEKDMGAISTADDTNGELTYMHTFFDSFTSKNEGYGVAIPIQKKDIEFIADKWYSMD
ncbi:MAG: DUF4838 domain-containing protein [Clostridia bacterium]|nr:DUF4838 domain-containing protein [Clostridia bacterium]